MAVTACVWPDRLPRLDAFAALVPSGIAIVLRLYPRSATWPPRRWISLIALAALLASIFWAADQGLELIRPPGSRRHDRFATLGGYELWMLLCPGLTLVGLAGLARALALGSHRR